MSGETHTPDDRFDPYFANRKTMRHLLAIVGDALQMRPPLWLNALLGDPRDWIPPYPSSSEFSIMDPRALLRTFKYLADVTLPAIPFAMPENLPLIGGDLLFRPTTVHFQPDEQNDPYSFPEEAWIFVNGIATNPDLAHVNARFLVSLFRRPITIIQNASDSVGVDLLEAMIGKSWATLTEASAKVYPFVRHALANASKKRVVVLCHSQGTIIMGNVLRALVSDSFKHKLFDTHRKMRQVETALSAEPPDLEDKSQLAKLEIYAFANCCDIMRHAPGLSSPRGNPIPYIENFGNENDLVARTGMLAPRKEHHQIIIDGVSFWRPGMWGHALNLHYLSAIRDHLEDPDRHPNPYLPMDDHSPPRPRFYDSFHGAVPEPF